MKLAIELHDEMTNGVAIRPVQFDSIWKGTVQTTPECKLLVAMLVQAANDLKFADRPKNRKAQRIHREAFHWVMSNDRSHPFTFINVCEALKISAQALRAKLVDLPQYRLPQAA